jgi:hypothetical protein
MSLDNLPDFVDILEGINIANDEDIFDKINSTYYNDVEELKLSGHKKHKYHALHLNIQSLPAKFDKLCDLICSHNDIGMHFDFILLCETFLTNEIAQQFNIKNYNMVFNNRANQRRGGVLIYIHKKYKLTNLNDINIFIQGEFESIFVEVEYNKQKLIIGEIYRVPNTNIGVSLERYESVLEKLNSYKHPIIIGTDQNFNYMNIVQHGKTQELLNKFVSNGLIPTITKTTRITHNTASLIDNLYLSFNELT